MVKAATADDSSSIDAPSPTDEAEGSHEAQYKVS